MSRKLRFSFRSCRIFGIGYLLMGFFCFSAFASGNLISNPTFEGEEGGMPYDWLLFRGNIGEQLIVIEDDELKEERVFLIDSRPSDQFPSMGFGIRSMPVLAEPGETYVATSMVRTSDGGTASFYIDFWNKDLKRVGHRAVSSKETEWSQLSVSLETPEDAVLVSTILYTTTTAVGKAYFKDISLEKLDE